MLVAALASPGVAQVPTPPPAPPGAPPVAPPVAPAAAPPAEPTPEPAPVAADADTVPAQPVRRGNDVDLRAAWRFEVVDVGDSTFRFGVGGVPWVRSGVRGILVDPRRRDALVARFAVQRIAADTATALVLGQTQRVVTEHVALLVQPPQKPWRQRPFWQGAVTGVLTAGVLAAIGFFASQ